MNIYKNVRSRSLSSCNHTQLKSGRVFNQCWSSSQNWVGSDSYNNGFPLKNIKVLIMKKKKKNAHFKQLIHLSWWHWTTGAVRLKIWHEINNQIWLKHKFLHMMHLKKTKKQITFIHSQIKTWRVYRVVFLLCALISHCVSRSTLLYSSSDTLQL